MYFLSPFAKNTWITLLIISALFVGVYWAARPLRKRFHIGNYHLEFQRILFLAFVTFSTFVYDANLRSIFTGSGQASLPFRTIAELARKIRLRSATLIVDSNEDFKMELLNNSKNQEFMDLQRTLLSYCRYSKVWDCTVTHELFIDSEVSNFPISLRRASKEVNFFT